MIIVWKDLSQCDYYSFGPLKELGGFEDNAGRIKKSRLPPRAQMYDDKGRRDVVMGSTGVELDAIFTPDVFLNSRSYRIGSHKLKSTRALKRMREGDNFSRDTPRYRDSARNSRRITQFNEKYILNIHGRDR
ncbi:hypothetical protein ALC56_10346 [Trachymyrmex septentrionalis]|uniref:Uncharacterized protein n=1 Tax=Trachymyrmex septentrionalis TaxID=34720 RepID=A0A195F4S2_9HYME|nr:hypothetical protein ALC56_10346 [Trachymyrmex septentrionalis]